MNNFYIAPAITSLRPGAEFVMYNDDYETIQWIKINGNPPTWAEIQAKMIELEKADQDAEKNKVIQKKSILDRLGLTEDEAKLLLS